MQRSSDRILVTHAGALPRPPVLRALVVAKSAGEPYDEAELQKTLRADVAAAVRKQVVSGIDVVNDGELGKTNFTNYVRDRISGFELRAMNPQAGGLIHSVSARDEVEFADYYEKVGGGFRNTAPRRQAY